MKILLFDPQRYRSFRPSTAPLGLMSIATYLNSNGHNAEICDRSHEKASISQVISESKPDIIGISVTTYSAIKDALKIAECAKNKGLTVVLGGYTATSLSEKFLQNKNVDYISLGEGEETWLEIAQTLGSGESLDKIKGLAFVKDGKYYESDQREFTELKALPQLDWTLVDPENFSISGFAGKKQANIYYSKGCVANCSFCYNKQYHNCTRRCRNLDDVVEEMDYLISKHGFDSFNFTDDLMFYTEDQAVEIAEKFIEKGISEKCGWIAETYIGALKKQETFDLLYKSGCRNLIFGVETGSPDMQKVLNKKISSEAVLDIVEMCCKAGITPLLTFMLGLPGETDEDIKQTVALVKKLDKAICCTQLFVPTPGSKIYEQLLNEGKITKKQTLEHFSKIAFGEKIVENISDVSTAEIHTVYRYFKLKEFTYKDKNSDDEQMLKVVLNVIKSMTGKGLVYFVSSGINNAVNLVKLLSFFAHPNIRKKYGLYFKK